MFQTIRAKLLGSFILLTLMVIGLAVYSIVKIQQSADGFADYREMARDVSLAGGLQSEMLTTQLDVLGYLNQQSPQNISDFQQGYQDTLKEVERAKTEIQKAGRAEQVAEIDRLLQEYKTEFERVVALFQKRDQLFENVIQKHGPDIEAAMTQIMRTANQSEVVAAVSEALRSFLITRIYTLRYLDTNTSEDMKRALDELHHVED